MCPAKLAPTAVFRPTAAALVPKKIAGVGALRLNSYLKMNFYPKRSRRTLFHPAFGLALGCAGLVSPAAAEEVNLDALINTGRQLLEENEGEIKGALEQLQGRADELREKMIDDAVPTAVYDRLEMKPVDAADLERIQQLAGRAIERGDQWAKVPELAAMRYQASLRGGEPGGYGSLHLRCQLDSPENAQEAVVTIIEDQVTDDSIRGRRWDLLLNKDPESGVWVPATASEATLNRRGNE